MAADLTTILSTDCMGSFVGFEGIALQVVARSFPKDADLAGIVAGAVAATECTATEDGRYVDLTGWHEGASAAEVYYERYSSRGREAHGWVDARTRKLVQSG